MALLGVSGTTAAGLVHEKRLLDCNRMKKPEIAKDLARESGVTEAEAADRLDGVVHEILSKLRSGKSASLPGVGRFRPQANGKVRFEPASAKGDKRRA